MRRHGRHHHRPWPRSLEKLASQQRDSMTMTRFPGRCAVGFCPGAARQVRPHARAQQEPSSDRLSFWTGEDGSRPSSSFSTERNRR
jgi:hypothetical protein